MIEPGDKVLSVRRQCRLLALARSGLYGEPRGESAENLALMRRIDEAYTRWPFHGARRMTAWLRREGESVNPKRARRLMRLMGLEAIYPKPRLSAPGEAHRRYPYLLKGVQIVRPDQAWSADITRLRLRRGFLYLTAILDWHSRHVLSWVLSSSLDAAFCVWALEEALRRGTPEVFNTDQGVQFASAEFTGVLERAGIAISMDGRGRAFDNIFSGRLWSRLGGMKYEEVYLNDYGDGREAHDRLGAYFRFYNEERPHQALDYRTPAEVYAGRTGDEEARPAEGRTVVPQGGIALRAPSVPATVGLSVSLNPAPFWS